MTRESSLRSRLVVATVRLACVMTVLAGLAISPASPAQAAESERWVLQSDSGLLTERFGSSEAVLATGAPAREFGEIIPSSDIFVTPNLDWSSRDGATLADVSNPDGIPNTAVGFEVIEHPIYLPYLRVGRYDVVIDNDQDGVYGEDTDEVLGFDEQPGFVAFYDGNHRTIDKTRMKEEFARPVMEAALTAAELAGTVQVYRVFDEALGLFTTGFTAGNAIYELSEHAADLPSKARYATEISDAANDELTHVATGPHDAIEWAAGQLEATADDLHSSALGIYADPPDPAYTTIADPDPVADRFDAGTADPVYNAFARVANVAVAAAGESRAVLHALERGDGAAADDAVPYVRLQAQALSAAGTTLVATLDRLNDAATGLAGLLRDEGATGALSDEQRDNLASAQARVAADGFDAGELAAFQAAGAGPATIEELKRKLLRVPAADLTGSLDARLDALAAAARDGRAGVRDAITQATNLAEDLTSNSPPTPVPDQLAVDAGDSATIDVLANDGDIDGDPLHVSDSTAPGQGQGHVTCQPNGQCTYTANRNASGGDYFYYTVEDPRGGSATTYVLVSIARKNFPPEPVADTLVTRVGVTRAIEVLRNDTDPNGDPLQVTGASAPAHGSVDCTASGRCTYVPEPGYVGDDAFTYTVDDGQNGVATATVAVTVSATNEPPVAVAGPDAQATEGSIFFVDGSGSTDVDGEIVEYRWDFGDGSDEVSGGPSNAHYYGRPGTFEVRLTVVDDGGATAQDTLTVVVANTAPTVGVCCYERAPVGTPRTYYAYVATGTSDPTTVTFDFGDGTPQVTRQTTGAGSIGVAHAYAAVGTYVVAVSAVDGSGASASAQSPVIVADAVADAGPDQTAVEGEQLTFGGNTTPSDSRTQVVWQYGDGEAGSGTPQTHIYRDEGTYTATVTVADDKATISDSAEIEVSNAPPVATMLVTPGPDASAPVSMRAFARDPGVDDVLTFAWDFGDGMTASGDRTTHVYTQPGTYDVRLDVSDGDGATTSVHHSLVVGPRAGDRDTRGREFWLTFPLNYIETPVLTLFLAAEEATSGRVEIPDLGFTEDFAVTPGHVTSVVLPPAAQLRDGRSLLGVHVTAERDVSVYGLNRIKYTTDAYVGLPVDALGTRYRIMSYTELLAPEAAIVATANDTTVTVTPAAALVDGRPAGVPFTVELDLGETYQLSGAGDLTGTLVEADAPVAAFGAHACANVPRGTAYCDHLVEQMPPLDSWGREFVTMPLATRSRGDTFRILAAEDGTRVAITGQADAVLDAGAYVERLIDGPATITADRPVLVAQYSNGSTFDSSISDPFMVVIPPFEQFQANYTVTTPASGFQANFLNLVVRAAGAGSVTVDGVTLPADSFVPVPGSDFVGRQLTVGPGDHRITSSEPLGVIVYGFDQYDSFGYGGGFGTGSIATVTELAIEPATETRDVGTEGCVDARATTGAGVAVPDVRIDFAVAGANAATGFASTRADGRATFCYTGTTVGQDLVTALLGRVSASAAKTWRAANRAPVAEPDATTTSEGTPAVVPLATLLANDSDPDSDQLAVSAVDSGPATHGTAVLGPASATYTPLAGFSGEATFEYTIADGRGASATAQVRVTVTPATPNRPPVLEAVANRTVDEQTPLVLTAVAADPDGDRPAFSLDGAPPGAAIDPASGRLTWTPTEEQGPGTYRFEVRAGDGLLSVAVPVTITVAEVNRAPVPGPLGDQALAAGAPLAAHATATDPDVPANGLSFALAEAPAGATIDVRTGVIGWTASGTGAQAFGVRVADDGTPPLSAQARFTATPSATGGDLILGCAKRDVVLVDVVPEARRVRLIGVADRRFAGRRVEIVFEASRKTVARPTVQADGSFTATAPLPPRRLRATNRARYMAHIGNERSLNLKLMRRLVVSGVGARGGKVTITGRVVGPFLRRKADRAIVVQRRLTCSKTEKVGQLVPRADGRFTATVDAPAGQSAAVYRLRTKVRHTARDASPIQTYSLPRAVDF